MHSCLRVQRCAGAGQKLDGDVLQSCWLQLQEVLMSWALDALE